MNACNSIQRNYHRYYTLYTLIRLILRIPAKNSKYPVRAHVSKPGQWRYRKKIAGGSIDTILNILGIVSMVEAMRKAQTWIIIEALNRVCDTCCTVKPVNVDT